MSRVKINIPEKSIFSCKHQISITEINYGNHLSNDAVLGIIHNARVLFLNSIDCSEKSLEGETGIIMSDTAVVYKNEGFHNDELSIDIFINQPGKINFDIYYRLTRISDKKIIAEAKTGIVCFNYSERKVAEVPQSFISKIGF